MFSLTSIIGYTRFNPITLGDELFILIWNQCRLYENYYNTYKILGDPPLSLENTIRLGLACRFLGLIIHFFLLFLLMKHFSYLGRVCVGDCARA